MSEKLKELLEKINHEGVEKAEQNARAIEKKAEDDAGKIIADAEDRAAKIVNEAIAEAKKTTESSTASIRQAARDLMLSLKQDIKDVFDKIVGVENKKAVSTEYMAGVLGRLIERYVETGGRTSDVTVLLKKEDLEKLKEGFVSSLQEKCRDGIEFRPSPNINAGFSVSFDKGRSFLDFSDEALTEALCAYLNQELAALLKG